MRACDRLHDRESEADTVILAVVRRVVAKALKRPQQPVDLIGRNYRAGVGHRDERTLCPEPGGDVNSPTGHVVAHRVAEEVRGQSLGEARVALSRSRMNGGLNCDREPVKFERAVEQGFVGDQIETERLSAL